MNKKTDTLPTSHSRNISITGIIFSIVVTAGFVWATVQLYTLWSGPGQLTVNDMQSNEQRAFLNLRSIAQAQKKYKETDWDGDGKKTYAKYFIHLWTSVSAAGDPVCVELIPKKLGFAIEPARAINGYYFVGEICYPKLSPEYRNQKRHFSRRVNRPDF